MLLADSHLRVLFCAGVMSAFAYHQIGVGIPLHVTAAGHSTAVVGTLLSLNAAIGLATEMLVAGFARRYNPVLCIAAGFALVGVGIGATGLAWSVPALALTVLVWTVGEMIMAPVASAYVADIAPAGLRGRYQAAWGLSSAFGMMLAPAVGGILFQWRPDALWALCAAFGVGGALLVYRLRPDRGPAPVMRLRTG